MLARELLKVSTLHALRHIELRLLEGRLSRA
jgi:hypothetical protein